MSNHIGIWQRKFNTITKDFDPPQKIWEPNIIGNYSSTLSIDWYANDHYLYSINNKIMITGSYVYELMDELGTYYYTESYKFYLLFNGISWLSGTMTGIPSRIGALPTDPSLENNPVAKKTTMNGDNTYVVAWYKKTSPSTVYGYIFQFNPPDIDAGFMFLTTPWVTSSSTRYPVSLSMYNGIKILAWTQYYSSSRVDLYYRTNSGNGNTWSNYTRLSGANCSYWYLSPMNENNRCYMFWIEASYVLYCSYFDGTSFQTPMIVNENGPIVNYPTSNYDRYVKFNQNGFGVYCWLQDVTIEGLVWRKLYARTINNGTMSEIVQIDEFNTDRLTRAIRFNVCINENNWVIISYYMYRSTSPRTYNIYSRCFDGMTWMDNHHHEFPEAVPLGPVTDIKNNINNLDNGNMTAIFALTSSVYCRDYCCECNWTGIEIIDNDPIRKFDMMSTISDSNLVVEIYDKEKTALAGTPLKIYSDGGYAQG